MFMFIICSAVVLAWLVWMDWNSERSRRERGGGPFDLF